MVPFSKGKRGRPIGARTPAVGPFGIALREARLAQHRSLRSLTYQESTLDHVVSEAERGKSWPSVAMLDAITQSLGLPIGQFDDIYIQNCPNGYLLHDLAERMERRGEDWRRVARTYAKAAHREFKESPFSACSHAVDLAYFYQSHGQLRRAFSLLTRVVRFIGNPEVRYSYTFPTEARARRVLGYMLFRVSVLPIGSRERPPRVRSLPRDRLIALARAEFQGVFAMEGAKPQDRLLAAYNMASLYAREFRMEQAAEWYDQVDPIAAEIQDAHAEDDLLQTVLEQAHIGRSALALEYLDLESTERLLPDTVATMDPEGAAASLAFTLLAFLRIRQGRFPEAKTSLDNAFLAVQHASTPPVAAAHAHLEAATLAFLEEDEEEARSSVSACLNTLAEVDVTWPDVLETIAQAHGISALCSMVLSGDLVAGLQHLALARDTIAEWPTRGTLGVRRSSALIMLDALLAMAERSGRMPRLGIQWICTELLRLTPVAMTRLRTRQGGEFLEAFA